jgi:serine/threonine-protein kinase RsbW
VSTGDVIGEPACVRLEIENRPENVALVRAALSGLSEAAGFDAELTSDIQTAVSEACNNVVLHAYEGASGPMEITVSCWSDRIDVLVADHGTGITRLASAGDHMGLGLALISALADQAEFTSPNDGGTEVRMRFRRTEDASEDSIPRMHEWAARPPDLNGDVVLRCQPVTVLRHVLGRVARAIAAYSHFTVSGAAELHAINDAVADYAEAASGGNVLIAISGSSHRLTLEGWPFSGRDGPGADGDIPQRARGGLAASEELLKQLVDQLSFEPVDTGRRMHVLLLDHGQGHDTAR